MRNENRTSWKWRALEYAGWAYLATAIISLIASVALVVIG